MKLLAFLLAASLQAAPLTGPEIVADFCPPCVQTDAETFTTGSWIIAFDESYRLADPRDFNGLVVSAEFADGLLLDWFVIASTYPMEFGVADGVAFAASDQPTAFTAASMNYWGHQQALSWTRPADLAEIPEPGTLGLLLAGLWVAWRRK